MRELVLVQFPKSDRNPLLRASYRPITLLTADCEILGRILADRLTEALPGLIHPDQAGFVPGRNTSQNIWRLFQVQDGVRGRFPRAACLVLDIEKAFDTLAWQYLFEALRRVGIGPQFIAYTRLLYTDLTTRVRIGRFISSPIPIKRGTHQGCPLYPCDLRHLHGTAGSAPARGRRAMGHPARRPHS